MRAPIVSATMKRMDTPAEESATPEQEKSSPALSGGRFPIELWMVVVALVVRILLLSMASNVHFQQDKDDLSFVNEVSQIAGALAGGHGYTSPFGGPSGPTAWIPPVYPALCAIIFKLLGGYSLRSVIWVLVMNSLFSAFTIIPLVQVAERLFDRRIALLSGWLWAVVPYFAKWSITWIWETTLSTLLLLWLLLQFLKLRDELKDRNTKPWHWVAFGLLWGLAMLTNPSVLTVVGLCFLWLLRERGFRVWKPMATAILMCAIVISPWLLRNRVVMHRWIFIRSNLGYELFLGNYHGSSGACGGGIHIWMNGDEWRRYISMGEAAFIEVHARSAKLFIRQYPLEFLQLCLRRFLDVWDGRVLLMRPAWAKVWLSWLYPVFTVTTVSGLLVMWRKRIPLTTLIFLIFLVYPWPYYIACAQSRFRHLVDPLILMIAVFLVLELPAILTLRILPVDASDQPA